MKARQSASSIAAVQKLWPPGMGRGSGHGEHYSRSCLRNLRDLFHPTPFGCDHEQRLAIGAAEHARETAAVQLSGLEHLAAFPHSYALLVGNIRIPDRPFGICANAVWHALLEVSPDPPVGEVAVSGDIECRKPLAVRLRHDQG